MGAVARNAGVSREELLAVQELVLAAPVSDHVIDYAVALSAATRPNTSDGVKVAHDYVEWGAGPRASQYLVLGAKARALTSGRYHVSFDDIRSLAHPVLRHRVLTNFHAQSEGITSDTLVDRLLEAVPAPKSGM